MKTTDNIGKILTPQCEFKASAGLKNRILEAAAVIAIVLVFRPSTTPMYAASDFFHSAIEYFTGHPSFVATLEVRTKPKESFSYINISRRFIKHTMAVDPQTGRWPLEKSVANDVGRFREYFF